MTDRPERSLFEPRSSPALLGSLRKLDPRHMVRNPVMFVVEVGARHHDAAIVDRRRARRREPALVHVHRRGLAVADGRVRQLRRGDRRGPRQGPGRRAARDAHGDDGAAARRHDEARPPSCAAATSSSSRPARSSPATAPSSRASPRSTSRRSPASRRPSSARPAATAARSPAARACSRDRIVVEITQEPGQSLPRPHDRARRGRRAAQDAERDRPVDPARRPDARLPRRRRRRCGRSRTSPAPTISIDDPHRAARRAHPDDDRRAAERDRHRRHGPARAPQRARAVGPRGRGLRRRRRPAARQDRHDHARQPPGRGVRPDARRQRGRARRGGADVARSPTRRRRAARSSCWPSSTASASTSSRRTSARFVPVHRADAHERRRLQRHAAAQGRRRRDPALGRRRGRPGAARARSASSTGSRARAATPLAVARDSQVLGVIELKDVVKEGMRERFDHLRAMGIRTVMVTGDNRLTAAKIAEEAGRRRLPRRGDAGGASSR